MDSKKFLAFWGWKTLPWNEPIALERLYWQEHTKAVCSRMLFSLSRTASIFVVSAAPGHGKSTLARWLYHNINPSEHDVALFSMLHHESKSGWLVPRLAHYLGLNPEHNSPRTVIQQLHDARLHGKILTVIIDDAHKLTTPESFDEILSLSHVQSIVASRINFILIGNPKLMQTLQSLSSVQHRLSFWVSLTTLSTEELESYVNHRIETLNLPPTILQDDAFNLMSNYGLRTFAAVDAILEASMIEAFMRESHTINPDIMTSAMQFLGLQKLNEDNNGESSRSSKANNRRRAQSPGSAKPASSTTGSFDLNSLYYKSSGSHDPEES